MGEKKATREAYGEALAEFGAVYDKLVVLDADLAGATKTATFKKAFPDRHFDCGIAEGNMVSVAAGLSTTGLIPFASSFAMFLAGRAFEQIRNSIGYPHLNMRTIPGMTVICPADATEARAAVKAAIEYVGPVYLRFGRAATPVLFDRDKYKFELGKGVVMADGSDVTIVANGFMVAIALEARELLKNDGIDAAVINIHTIKPLDVELIRGYAAKTGAIVTAEEHNVIGGLGSAVCEAVCGKTPVPVLRVGVQDEFGRSGKVAPLLEYYGLTAANIAENCKAAIALKK